MTSEGRWLGLRRLVTGSGFPIGSGLIVTNAHGSPARPTTGQTADGTVLPASVVYADPEVDIAILRVPGFAGAA